MPVIINGENGKQLETMKWGLVPTWAKNPHIGYRLINVRDDTIFNKPIWLNAIQKYRVLIPANGFYEWRKPDNPNEQKQPFYIRPKQEELFGFAGVWATWKDSEGKELKTYSIITTEPNKEIGKIHNRMPVILYQKDESIWLESSYMSRDDMESLLRPYEDGGLKIDKVSRDVNSVRNNYAKLIYPISSQ